MLEERQFVDSINFRDSGHIEVRRVLQVLKDGVEVARQYHRHVVDPGGDLSNEDPKVVAVAEALWTPELIEAYEAKHAADLALVAEMSKAP